MKNNIQKDRIKIFLVGDAIEYGRLISYRRGFEELYCRTKILDIRSYYKINIFNRIINIFRKIPIYFGVKKLNLAVLRDVLEFKPNFVLFFKPTLILPNVLFEIKKENIKILSWCGDSVFFPKNLSGYFLKAIHLYDYHFTINFLNVGELLKKGARKSIFLPPAADSRIHYPTKPNPDEIKTIGADIVFVGTYEKDRAWHLEQLCKAGYNIKVYGNRWERCLKYSCLKRSGFITRNDVYCEDMSKVFNSSKIVLAFLRKHNRDSQTGRKIIQSHKDTITYGFNKDNFIHPVNFTLSKEKTTALISMGKNIVEIKSVLLGEYNLYNIMAALGFVYAEGIDPETAKKGIENLSYVPGRIEKIKYGDIDIYIDYAHTPDALYNVGSCIKNLNYRHIITVFGAGGDRDRLKRPMMAEAVEKFSDIAMVTTDNPRNEDPMKIIEDVIKGFSKKNYVVESDRREAIKKAILAAKDGDAILIAGKGHETYQIIKGERRYFSDRVTVRELLAEL